MVHYEPIILYECYRNATTFEEANSVNVSVFFDATQSGPDEIEGYIYYSIAGIPGKVSRYENLVLSPLIFRIVGATL